MSKRQTFLAIGLIGVMALASVGLALWARNAPEEQNEEVQPTIMVAAATGTEPAVPTTVASMATASPTETLMVATMVPTVQVEPVVEVAEPVLTTHVVADGETVYQIGRLYEVSPTVIIEANNLQNPDALAVGQELLIPGVAPAQGEASPTQPAAESMSEPAQGRASPTPAPTPTPPLPAPPANAPPTVNGVVRARVAFMPDEVIANTREIFARGQAVGRNPRAFSKVGDSVIAPPFLKPYDVGNYDLGIYNYLEGVVQYFSGSFARDSASLRIGLHSWTVFDPVWADKSRCLPNEGSLPCEIRLHNPAFLIIRLGSNDVRVGDLYEREMRRIVEYSIENGVIPILGTKADRNEGSDYNNQVVRSITAEYQIPLWDFDLVAGTIPGRGLDTDGVHLNGDGHFMQNVSALVVLDRLWREVIYEGDR